VKHGAAEWKKPQAVSIDATLIQYPTLHKFQQKTIEFTLKQVHNPQISLPHTSPPTHTRTHTHTSTRTRPPARARTRTRTRRRRED
jgi:hypothetical protein